MTDEAARARVCASAARLGLDARLSEQVAAYARSVPGYDHPTPAPVVACDLDRTLIYSAGAVKLGVAPLELAVAELQHGEPMSYWTADAQRLLIALSGVSTFVPTTTRTTSQFFRVRFPAEPRYAITANGGHILVDGRTCDRWAAQVAEQLSRCAPLSEVVDHVRASADPAWVRKHRIADDLFTYLVVERDLMPARFLADLTDWCAERGWTVSMQGRKVYCVPVELTKESAVAEVASRVGSTAILAAGDSLLDAGILSTAAFGVRPAHGELHTSGWQAPHVVVTEAAGAEAGEEIVSRLLAAVLTPAA
ncbi:HAD family hydrolase [Cellulomonas sp. URHD0024]|uniref:HAD family hydrolase n=1 Tax=Cellulomonas sp. URHD0024 TaxID=1302620 RepID=UPI0003FD9A58|nr:HAD family hydrolase [Cellulomonas sp. URHD0024]